MEKTGDVTLLPEKSTLSRATVEAASPAANGCAIAGPKVTGRKCDTCSAVGSWDVSVLDESFYKHACEGCLAKYGLAPPTTVRKLCLDSGDPASRGETRP